MEAKQILIVLEETESSDGESFWTYACIVDEDFEKEPILDIDRLVKGISTGTIRDKVRWPRRTGDKSSVYHSVPLPPGVSRVILTRIPTLQAVIASSFLKKELFDAAPNSQVPVRPANATVADKEART